jgi:hypothetical protein
MQWQNDRKKCLNPNKIRHILTLELSELQSERCSDSVRSRPPPPAVNEDVQGVREQFLSALRSFTEDFSVRTSQTRFSQAVLKAIFRVGDG